MRANPEGGWGRIPYTSSVGVAAAARRDTKSSKGFLIGIQAGYGVERRRDGLKAQGAS